jgi:hypothetical protein
VLASGGELRKGRDNRALVGGRARDFVLRASPKIVTVNAAGGSFDSSVVRPHSKASMARYYA